MADARMWECGAWLCVRTYRAGRRRQSTLRANARFSAFMTSNIRETARNRCMPGRLGWNLTEIVKLIRFVN